MSPSARFDREIGQRGERIGRRGRDRAERSHPFLPHPLTLAQLRVEIGHALHAVGNVPGDARARKGAERDALERVITVERLQQSLIGELFEVAAVDLPAPPAEVARSDRAREHDIAVEQGFARAAIVFEPRAAPQ